MRNWIKGCVAFVLAVIISSIYAPRLLAFPYTAGIGHHQVYSETPIEASVAAVVAKADLLVARSKLPTIEDQSIFLTRGGWRWRWLTQSGPDGPFGLSRAGVEVIVMNRSSFAHDTVFRATAVGGERSLSGAIAHEITHGAIRRHFGILADTRYPQWLREGYCDFVAGESTLSDTEAIKVLKTNPYHPALAYWRGRQRVAAELARSGGSVEKLFARYAR